MGSILRFLSSYLLFFLVQRRPLRSTLFPYTTLFRSIETNSHITGSFKRLTFSINRPQPTRSEERFSRNAETELVCRLLLEKKNLRGAVHADRARARDHLPLPRPQGKPPGEGADRGLIVGQDVPPDLHRGTREEAREAGGRGGEGAHRSRRPRARPRVHRPLHERVHPPGGGRAGAIHRDLPPVSRHSPAAVFPGGNGPVPVLPVRDIRAAAAADLSRPSAGFGGSDPRGATLI